MEGVEGVGGGRWWEGVGGWVVDVGRRELKQQQHQLAGSRAIRVVATFRVHRSAAAASSILLASCSASAVSHIECSRELGVVYVCA